MLVRFVPEARFRNGLDPRNMTRDAGFARERREDPLIVRTVTASWFFAMETAPVRLRSGKPKSPERSHDAGEIPFAGKTVGQRRQDGLIGGCSGLLPGKRT